jgi:hypothetical protein
MIIDGSVHAPLTPNSQQAVLDAVQQVRPVPPAASPGCPSARPPSLSPLAPAVSKDRSSCRTRPVSPVGQDGMISARTRAQWCRRTPEPLRWPGLREPSHHMPEAGLPHGQGALRNVDPACVSPGTAVPSPPVAMGRAQEPRGRGQAEETGHGEGPCWRTAGLPASMVHPALPWRWRLPDVGAAVLAALAGWRWP